MIAKIILPWFGGSAAVWTTAMMFFQVSLLVGYLYSFLSVRFLKPKQQAYLHITLLLACLLLLPISPSASWKPLADSNPTLRILGLLTATIGLPYLLLSSTGPLLQAWYLQTRSGVIPYRLFALSNLGSMLALISFPVLVEPRLSSHGQTTFWSWGFGLFAAACAAAAWHSRSGAKAESQAEAAARPATRPAPGKAILWISLAACAAVMLLAVTTHMSQNVAPIPFLWVLPLALYLLSFILCFESDRIYDRRVFVPLLALSLGAMAFTIYTDNANPSLRWAIPVFSIALFVSCMVCHGELARLKPHPRFLTLYYLMISVGGALGGVFVGLAAPLLFDSNLELPISIAACALLTAILLWDETIPLMGARFGSVWAVRMVLALCTLSLAGYLGYREVETERIYRYSARNFYGSLHVRDDPDSETNTGIRFLVHGTINHGGQLLNPKFHHLPTTYYGERSGIGRTLRAMKRQHPSLRVGIIGLGSGVLASYCRTPDVYRFYEINALVYQIATTQFTFLPDCGANKQVVFGDARLTMERQADQNLDVLAVDAFSSDAIPVHLLTREAFALYFRHLNPNGILAIHTSNRYLNLAPVVAQNAKDMGKVAVTVDQEEDDTDYLFGTTWVLVSANPEAFHQREFEKAAEPSEIDKKLRPWTDDYSNLFEILK
ncbi:MAG: fused MFS/spermidine synthase [Bryobacteraceae bacterium]